jgi:F0F1-type ATP synthase membrane subunit a
MRAKYTKPHSVTWSLSLHLTGNMRVSTLILSVLATCTFASNVVKVDDVQYYVPSKVEVLNPIWHFGSTVQS